MAIERGLPAGLNAKPGTGDELEVFPKQGRVSASSHPLRPVRGSSLSTFMSHDLDAGGELLALTLERTSDPGLACIHVEGSLSVKNVRVLVELLDRQLAVGRRWVLVEAHLLSRLDAAAVSSLRASYQQFVRAGGSLLIRGVRLEMLDHTGAPEPPHTTAVRPATTSSRRARRRAHQHAGTTSPVPTPPNAPVARAL
jgi:anti-anti-sigma regulatory factor